MYAIVETGGKQYHVQENSKFAVEKLPLKPGEELALETVLFVGGEKRAIGAPYVEGAKVLTEVVAQGRGPKVLIFKRRRRKDSKSMHGHRQDYTLLRVKEILIP